ncbi:MAG: 16S rRNA (cytosine(967)-C(5))-methyltransferase RsmB [Clostridiales bacterium]|nr:16S rRNA (cytosine(967)-C(5))-methyltransferase RsmB [Clostridiales bacterium]
MEKEKITDKTRKGAFLVLKDVEESKAYTHLALQAYIRRVKPPGVPFLREMVYGTVRRKITLDWVIGNFVKTPIEDLPVNDRILLRMGLHQLIFMNSVPDYAAVSETVELAKRYARGRDAFINGVLRQFIRDRGYIEFPKREDGEVAYLSVRYSFEPWIVSMWLDQFGDSEKTELLLASLDQRPEFHIRVNSLRTDTASLADRLEKRGYEVSKDPEMPRLLSVRGEGLVDLNLFGAGLFSVQDKGSQLVVDMLGPQPGETIIDVCAGTGGKTMAIAESMQNMGSVIATDIYKRKTEEIQSEAGRLSVSIVETWTWDATTTDSAYIDKADRVLVDAPCSGLGTARRKPEVKYKKLDSAMTALPQLQSDILNASSQYVKPGGILVYATCTIAERENEEVVTAFLRKNRAFKCLEQKQLLPNTDGTDGFFICKMQREAKEGFGV